MEAMKLTVIEITDLSDPALDIYARLTEHQLRQKRECGLGLFIAESRTVVTLALKAGLEPVSLLIDKAQLEGPAAGLAADCAERFPGLPIYTGDRDILEELTGFRLSQGLLAAMKRPPLPSVEDVCQNAKRIAVLENIVDAVNVGALFRSAAAMGIDAVLVSPRCSDPLNRRSARVSMGTVFQIPWTVIGDSPADWPGEGLRRLQKLGFVSAAMALSDDSISVADKRLKEAERLAILLGTEGTGLMRETIEAADYTVKIPMHHGVDSLNVAAASAVAFWEIGRNENVL